MSALRDGDARVAQLVEHVTENHGVGGSTPSPGTIAIAVKADHPDWRVFYLDETLFDLNIRLSVPIQIPDRVT